MVKNVFHIQERLQLRKDYIITVAFLFSSLVTICKGDHNESY